MKGSYGFQRRIKPQAERTPLAMICQELKKHAVEQVYAGNRDAHKIRVEYDPIMMA